MVSEKPRITFINQKVKDIKLPQNVETDWIRRHALEMGKLKSYLNKHAFIPANKVTCELSPRKFSNNLLVADLSGQHLFDDPTLHKDQHFPLKIRGSISMDFSIDEIFRRVEGAIVDDGGNVQNMIVNAAYFLASLNYCSTTSAELPEMIAFASSDPFELLPEKLSNQLGEVCTYHNIELEDRFSLQSPFLNQETNEQGVLAFTSVPKLASGALIDTLEGNSDLEREFGKSDCYVLSEPQNPLVNYMGRVTDDSRKAYRVLINASTAFRPQVATESFAKGVVLPMNNEEASEVARIFMVQGLGEEMSKLERPPFPCPLTPSANEIDPEALKALDTSMFQYNRFNPFGPQNYACPISFGPLGGLIVGTGIENLVCFTSIPSNEGSKSLLKTYGASEIDWADPPNNEVGSGDAVATVVAIFNTIEPSVFLSKAFEGRESDNQIFVQLASTIFVNIVSRIAGCFLYHSKRTNWIDIDFEKFPTLLEDAAVAALTVARKMLVRLNEPQIEEVEDWGIKVAVWIYGTTRKYVI